MKMHKLCALIVSVIFSINISKAQDFDCRWEGTSPFWSGVCSSNEVEKGRASNVSEATSFLR
jgi:hypothetical protein